MLELTKKQVGAIIKVLEADRDARPLLSYMMIDKKPDSTDMVAIVTDGFVMAVLNTGYTTEEHTELVGKGVPVDAFKRWYVTAKAKDAYTAENIAQDITDLPQPIIPWQRPIPETPAPIDLVALNPAYMKNLQDIAGGPLYYTTYGKDKPVVAERNGNRYLVMPVFIK